MYNDSVKAVTHIIVAGRIFNSDYQKLTGVICKTAARDLDALAEKGILVRVGEKRGSHFMLADMK